VLTTPRPADALHVCHVCGTTLDSHYFSTLGRGLHARGLTLSGVSLTDAVTPVWLRDVAGSISSSTRREDSRIPARSCGSRAGFGRRAWTSCRRI